MSGKIVRRRIILLIFVYLYSFYTALNFNCRVNVFPKSSAYYYYYSLNHLLKHNRGQNVVIKHQLDYEQPICGLPQLDAPGGGGVSTLSPALETPVGEEGVEGGLEARWSRAWGGWGAHWVIPCSVWY